MYIQQSIEYTLRSIIKRQEYGASSNSGSLPNLSDSPKPANNDNGVALGIAKFCIVLGGILFIVTITGIITFIYRRRLSSRKGPDNTNTICNIVDFYSIDYVDPNKNRIIMKVNKSNVSMPTYNENGSRIQTPMGTPTFLIPQKSKPSPIIGISTSQISSPILNSSVSIYDKERAKSLASSLSRSAETRIAALAQPAPVHVLTNNKQQEAKETSKRSEMKSSSNAASFDEIIPSILDDSKKDTNAAAPININANWFTYPIDSPTIPPSPSRAPTKSSSNNGSATTSINGSPANSLIFPENLNRKSKRNLRIRIDTFNQFNLFGDKPDTITESFTQGHNSVSESKGNNNNNKKKESIKFDSSKMITNGEKSSERYRSLGETSVKNNQRKRNGSIFDQQLERSKTIT